MTDRSLPELRPIAFVRNDRDHLDDDDWGAIRSEIILNDDLDPELLAGLASFSHVEVVFVFHRLPEGQRTPATRHPRHNTDWPRLGLLAQRSAHHPNPIGLTICQIVAVVGRTLTVQGLDAVQGSPVLDLKPVFQEFLPSDVKQPDWVSELMQNYWSREDDRQL